MVVCFRNAMLVMESHQSKQANRRTWCLRQKACLISRLCKTKRQKPIGPMKIRWLIGSDGGYSLGSPPSQLQGPSLSICTSGLAERVSSWYLLGRSPIWPMSIQAKKKRIRYRRRDCMGTTAWWRPTTEPGLNKQRRKYSSCWLPQQQQQQQRPSTSSIDFHVGVLSFFPPKKVMERSLNVLWC